MKKIIMLLFYFSIILSFPTHSIARLITVCSSGCDYTGIQAAFNNENLAPGDIIEIQDSRTYAENIFWGSNDAGDSDNRVILRASSGQTPTIAGLIHSNSADYIQIGDEGHGTITVDPTNTGWIDGAIVLSGSNYCIVEYMIVRDVHDGNGIFIGEGGHHNIIQDNTVYNIGTSYWGSGSQGEGIIVYLNGQHNVIQNNTIHDCAHGNIGIYGDFDANTRYNQILNNYINSGRGEGVSVLAAEYVLVDGNRIYNTVTVQTGLPKPAVQLSASRNCSIRRNVIYNGHHYYVFEMYDYGSGYRTDNNYIYNNTIHTYGTSNSASGGGSAVILGGYISSNTSCSNNKFYNNIFWNINFRGQTGWMDSSYKIIFFADYAGMLAANDWGDDISQLNVSGLGGTDIKNNVLRSNGGSGYSYILGYHNSNGSFYDNWSMEEMHDNFPAACSGNIDIDPALSQDPAGNIGSEDTWWHLQNDSPCIDAGIPVRDTNGDVGGWSDLTYEDFAPDIGAYEGNWPPKPPANLRIVP